MHLYVTYIQLILRAGSVFCCCCHLDLTALRCVRTVPPAPPPFTNHSSEATTTPRETISDQRRIHPPFCARARTTRTQNRPASGTAPEVHQCASHYQMLICEMAAVSDCFSIGSIVSCTTCFLKTVEGEVLAFDPLTKMLILSILLPTTTTTTTTTTKKTTVSTVYERCVPVFLYMCLRLYYGRRLLCVWMG